MNKRTFILAATALVLLAVPAAYIYFNVQTTAPEALIELPPLPPSEIVKIEVNGAIAQRISPTEWTITLPGATTIESASRPAIWQLASPTELTITLPHATTRWPASTPAIRSALRAISELNALEAEHYDNAAPFALQTRLTITTEDGESHQFEWGSAAIGGNQTVTIDNSLIRAPSKLLAPLTAGPAAWRERSVFPNIGPAVTYIFIEQPATESSPALELALVKTAGRWLIAAPALARADKNAVENAIGRVAGAVIERFIDEPPTLLETGLDSPIFIITVVSGDTSRRVRFGANADAAGIHRFATTGQPGVLFVADTELLSELRLDPAAYTDRRITATPAADIHHITINTQRASRTLSGWSETTFSAEQIIQTLTADADSIVAFEEPAGYTPITTITLEDLSQSPIDIIEIGQDDSNILQAKTQLPGGAPIYYTLPPTFRQHLNNNETNPLSSLSPSAGRGPG